MTILPQTDRGLSHDYAEDDSTSICSLYSNLPSTYNTAYVQQDQHQYHHLEVTSNNPQPIMTSLEQLPTMFMSQSQNSHYLNNNSAVNNDGNNDNDNCIIKRRSENSSTLINDNSSSLGDIPFHSRDDSIWPTTMLETSGQISMYGKAIPKSPSDINNSERGVAGFVSKLYQSLQMSENNYTFVRWCRHDGKDMFLIDCIPRFTAEVLPRLFKHCKFQSFVRQLNIYGFQRDTDARKSKDTKDKEVCRWYHFFFRPGRRDLIHLIRRKATLHTRRKRIQSAADQHPEQQVAISLGDDSSDGDGEKSTQQRHSSVSNSISNLNFQPYISSSLQTSSPQDIYSKAVLAPYFGLVDSIMQQTASPSPSPPPTSSSSTSSSSSSLSLSPLYMQETLQPQTKQLIETTGSTPHSTIYHQHSVYQMAVGNPTQLSSSSSSSSPHFEFNMENELQRHLFQLQISYKNDHDFYSNQIQLAHAHIKEQKEHIYQLEAMSSHHQQQDQQRTALTSSSNYIMNREPVYKTWNCGKDIFEKANPTWSVLSSLHDLPNPQYHSEDVDIYSTTSHLTNDSLSTSLLLSSLLPSHTKNLQP